MHDFQSFIELNALTAVLPYGLIVIGDDSEILSVSEPLCRMTGYSEKELIGQNVDMLIPKDTQNPHREPLKYYVRNGHDPKPMKPLSDVPLLRKAGDVIRVSIERYIFRYDGELRFGGSVKPLAN